MHSYATVTKDLDRCRRERRLAIRRLHRYEHVVEQLLEATDHSEMSNQQAALDDLRELQAQR